MVVALAGVGHGARAQASRKLYFVPGIHYGTPGRASMSMTAFLDGRRGIIGKGHVLILEGGPDAEKAQLGLADVSHSPVGYSAHLGFLRTRRNRLAARPNANYAGTEVHAYLSVLNLGLGFYAPTGFVNGRRGLL